MCQAKSAMKLSIHLPDEIVSFHGPQITVVENGHEETFANVIQVLAQCKYVISFFPGNIIQLASLNVATEPTNRFLQRAR